jgi:two-component system response regulator YesN
VSASLKCAPLASLHEISCQLAIERHTIEKAVRTETGKSFRTLRSEIAFEAARGQLLSQPGRSIKEISYDLGYSSPRTFSRFIRRFCGVAPNKFRRIGVKSVPYEAD